MFSDPVIGDHFFGRQEILDILYKRAGALKSGYRQNVAIIGHQQLGKTSILRHFLHTFKDLKVLSIYVEIKFQALDYFIDQFARSLLYQYLSQREPVNSTASLKELTQKASNSVPRTVQAIEEISQLLRQRRSEEAYSKLFEITSIVGQETGKHCIVVLDEFHRLGEFGIKNAFSDFGKRIMVQKNTMYLLSSSSFSASKRILAEKLALLFGNFERIYLEPFDFGTSFEFLKKKLFPAAMDDVVSEFIVGFTDGHPFFLETVTSRIRESALSERETTISRATVARVLLKLLFESQGVLNQFFLKLISPWMRADSHGSHILILTALARGVNKLKDLAEELNRGQKEVSAELQQLMENELVIKVGVFYRFHNKIFKFWLKEVYERKELSLLGSNAKAEDFIASITKAMEECETLMKLGAASRIMNLFSLFNNEMVEIGEKKRKLPHFTEFIKVPAGSSGDETVGALIARGHGRCWVCKIVEEKASEKEILELIENSPHNKNVSSTKVLVALNGIEENARLLAKEKKVLTLGLSRINLLMDIYGCSPIIHSGSKKGS